MRLKWLIFNLWLIAVCASAQNAPIWVKQHPVNEFGYAGVGMASMNEKGYINKAKERALADLASEINVQISSSSLLNTVEDNGMVKELYAETIRSTVYANIEKYRMVDSWQDGKEYWVYYELNRFDYEEYMEARRQKAIKDGFDFWYRGNSMINQGDMASGIDLLLKAWEVVQPVIHLDLRCSYNGKTVNLGTEIYASLTGVFNGITVSLNPETVNGQAFQSIETPVVVSVQRNGTPLKGISLQAKFLSGEGDVSSLTPTDANGESRFYIRNITSKQSQQEVCVSLLFDSFKILTEGKYATLFDKAMATRPEAILTINLKSKQLTAYIQNQRNELRTLTTAVQSMLTNNYFDVVETRSKADVVVTLENNMKKGALIPGELYNMVEYFSTLSVRILNNRTSAVILNYSLGDVRILVPENKSLPQAESMAVRELLKRLKKEFPAKLKSLTVDISGEIPMDEYVPEPSEPIVTQPVSEDVPEVTPYVPVQKVPVVQSVPENKPVIEEPQAETIRAEWFEGVFVEFSHLSVISNRSRINCKIINKNNDDVSLRLFISNQLVINENGEEVKIERIKLGADTSTYCVNALIVPDIPTELMIEVTKLSRVALLELNTGKENVKIRNLK
ncbi:LPP20 family lipoprotein [Phocaeicola plebeius]|uniref:LPP20 family lipoprotein n=1 Tax=Phocaeicola plebeius TaxID=310297 RepID=UPI0026EE2C81|nr:LPP20 family lipoprotein [Phocaeicola plebeius]